MTALPDIARDTAARHDMVPPGSIVLVMVSGGADSVSLLRLLAAGALGTLSELSALHVNHGLRGEESDADEAFVVALCAELGIPCEVVRFDVAAHAGAEGLNLEDAGRQVRYRFAASALDAHCEAAGRSAGAGRIAVAHTFDDRLETFLARMVSGSGAGGLRSIAPVRGRIVRPLIEARRADVTAYLGELGQPWREDATNADTSRQRAWVRHELLPLIEARNPAFDAVASRTLAILGEEDDLLTEMSEAFAHDLSRVEDGVLVFERTFMRTLSLPMARRTVRRALIDAFPEASRLEFEHVEAIVTGIAEDTFARDLPYGLRVEAEYSTLRISRSGASSLSVAPGLLELFGNADLGPGGSMSAREVPPDSLATGPDRVTIDVDAVRWPLTVEAVREGDRIKPLGMHGTKKVGDLLTDEKVPKRLRSITPVVRDGERVVWVAGVRLSDEYRVRSETKRTAELVWERPALRETESGETREGR